MTKIDIIEHTVRVCVCSQLVCVCVGIILDGEITRQKGEVRFNERLVSSTKGMNGTCLSF